jgi:site-specific recombinase XerD
MTETHYLYPEIEEFLALKKDSTAKVYRSTFRRFTKYYQSIYGKNKTISDFLDTIFDELKKPRREQKRIAESVHVTYIKHLKQEGLSGNNIRLKFAAIQNFLKYKGIIVSSIFIGNLPPQVGKKRNRKHEWTIEHLREFVDTATEYRDKALILCMLQSGLGVTEICAWNYGDIKDELKSGTLPICLHLVRQKTGIEFKTFFGRDSTKYLQIYLATRNNLKNKSPLILTSLGKDQRRTSILNL